MPRNFAVGSTVSKQEKAACCETKCGCSYTLSMRPHSTLTYWPRVPITHMYTWSAPSNRQLSSCAKSTQSRAGVSFEIGGLEATSLQPQSLAMGGQWKVIARLKHTWRLDPRCFGKVYLGMPHKSLTTANRYLGRLHGIVLSAYGGVTGTRR